MKNYEVMNCMESLNKLTECEEKFSIRFLHAMNTNKRILSPIFTDVDKMKNDLVRQYGKEDENGQVSVQLTNKEFVQKYNELLECENEVTLAKVSYEDLPDKLSVKVFNTLTFMVEEE